MEIVGVAGAGKSTIARKMIEETCDVQTSLSIKPYKFKVLGHVTSNLPRLLWLMFSGIPYRFLKALLYLECALPIYRFHKERGFLPCRIVLVDFGPVGLITNQEQKGYTRDAKWCERLGNRSREILDLIVWLDAPDEVLFNRINERQEFHVMQGEPIETVKAFLEDFRDAIGNFARDGTKKTIPCIRIDTNEISVEEVVREIKQAL